MNDPRRAVNAFRSSTGASPWGWVVLLLLLIVVAFTGVFGIRSLRARDSRIAKRDSTIMKLTERIVESDQEAEDVAAQLDETKRRERAAQHRARVRGDSLTTLIRDALPESLAHLADEAEEACEDRCSAAETIISGLEAQAVLFGGRIAQRDTLTDSLRATIRDLDAPDFSFLGLEVDHTCGATIVGGVSILRARPDAVVGLGCSIWLHKRKSTSGG